MMELDQLLKLQLSAAWGVMLMGVLWGMVMGLFFHKADWLGGYDSWRRRLLRLGHIACFGMGFLNIFYTVTLVLVSLLSDGSLEKNYAVLAHVGLFGWLLALVSMPTVCALSAWKKSFRQLFFIPVTASIVAILTTFYLTFVP